MTRSELIAALESGSPEVYEIGDHGLSLSEHGADLCRDHGLRVDVDAYGNAYVPEHRVRAEAR